MILGRGMYLIKVWKELKVVKIWRDNMGLKMIERGIYWIKVWNGLKL